MRKSLILFSFLILILMTFGHVRAQCKPTISWKIDPQFYVGETGKLIATINNGCDATFEVKTEVNTERTEGYIKVYKVQSEDETPRPKSHSTSGGVTSFYTSLSKSEKVNVVYFVQPDELALPGSYTLFENFYVDEVLEQSNEIKIMVSKPVRATYSILNQLKLNSPSACSITLNNFGVEIITSLKICLSSEDSIIHFSESCKSWENLPSGFTDKFNFYVTGLTPGNFQNPIKVDISYTTFTGLDISETYYHSSLLITAVKTEVPSLSYRVTKTDNSLSFHITNDGNGIAYDCVMELTSSQGCVLTSNDISNFTQSDQSNNYLILCPDLILPGENFGVTFNFNPTEISPPCRVAGTIAYKDSFGLVNETKITSLDLIQMITTTPKETDSVKKNYNLYIIIVAVVTIAIILIVFKVPKVRNFITQRFSKPSDKEYSEEESEENKD